MTLDEAIKHAEEVAEENDKFCYKKGGEGGYFNEDTDWNNTKCAEEHRQLAEWLKDYKRLLGQEPCDGAIRRQTALDCLTATKLKKFDFILNAREEIKKLPSVNPQPKTKWIPISERLPKRTGEYFVTVIDDSGEDNYYKAVGVAWFAHKKDYDIKESEWRELRIDEKVIAWMPLPAPYEPQESEE